MEYNALNGSLGNYAGALHPGMDSSLDPALHGGLEPVGLGATMMDGDGMPIDSLPVGEGLPLMEGAYSELHSIISEVGVPISTSHFDVHEELLWVGNQGGRVASYYGPAMERYSAFVVHPADEVRQVQSLDNGVLLLTKNNLKCFSRGGLIMCDYMTEEAHEMHCMLLTTNNSLLIGGQQNHILELDLSSAQEMQKYDVETTGVTIMKQANRFFFCGHAGGKVTLHDPRTFKPEHEFEAHANNLSDFDVHGNLLVTCGLTARLNRLACDRFLMVYDMRMMRAVTPLQVHLEPAFVRFIPTYTSRLAIISQTGQCQFCEPTGLANPADMMHVDTVGQLIMAFDVSSSRQALAFGDSGGCLHLWADSPQVTFNEYSRETEFPLPCMSDSVPHLDWSDDLAPLSLVSMPYTSDALLSDWPTSNCAAIRRRAPPVDPEILRSMKMVGFIGYAPNPRTKLRNQMPYKLNEADGEADGYSQVPESPIGREEEPHLYMVPKKYRKVTIKYSKLGLEDFDFKHYNKTMFAGLETHIPNAYCNSMIQVLYFLEPVRRSIQSHLCQKEFCLACELGFLFYMLDLSKGDPCQASNFLRAFRTIPEASALSLILADSDEATGKVNLGQLIQSWNRFILTQLHQEMQEQEGMPAYRSITGSAQASSESVVSQLFGTELDNCSTCRCGKETSRVSSALLFTLHHPDTSKDEPGKFYEFVELLRRSICLDQSTQAWCEVCEKYQPTVQTRKLRRLPDVLVINCQVNSPKDCEFWRNQSEIAYRRLVAKEEAEGTKAHPPAKIPEWPMAAEGLELGSNLDEMKNVWIPYAFRTKLAEDRSLDITPWNELDKVEDGEDDGGGGVYHLAASVAHVLDQRTGGNLMAHVRVGETYHHRKEGVTHFQWYLFNDFLIEPIDKFEAVQFDVSWKIPCVLYFVRQDLNSKYNVSIKNPIEPSVLLAEASLARKQRKRNATFMPLQISELPHKGDLVGLDAEFVTLNQEEAELRSDGTKSTIKPSQMSVARITCVRGQGAHEGIPFIDDYISTQEQVVDYLTQFSGIKPGDLDAKVSSKHLTTLKSTYLKLRFLIDNGVKFVGHGLRKDFRVINLMVPKEQVIDTVILFHIPRKRMISLRFLAWHFLELHIQAETHDSIEDANTALQLYRKYLALSNNGHDVDGFRKTLKQLYEEGRKRDWKVPE